MNVPLPWLRAAPRSLVVVLASGLGPFLVFLGAALFAEREACWLLPTLLIEPPAAATAGLLAALALHLAPCARRSPLLVWLLTAAGTLTAALALTFADLGVVTAWVAGPLVAGALLGGVPAAALARLLREEALREPARAEPARAS